MRMKKATIKKHAKNPRLNRAQSLEASNSQLKYGPSSFRESIEKIPNIEISSPRVTPQQDRDIQMIRINLFNNHGLTPEDRQKKLFALPDKISEKSSEASKENIKSIMNYDNSNNGKVSINSPAKVIIGSPKSQEMKNDLISNFGYSEDEKKNLEEEIDKTATPQKLSPKLEIGNEEINLFNLTKPSDSKEKLPKSNIAKKKSNQPYQVQTSTSLERNMPQIRNNTENSGGGLSPQHSYTHNPLNISKLTINKVFTQQQFPPNLSYTQRLKIFNPDLSNYHSNPYAKLFKNIKPTIKNLLKNVFMAMLSNYRRMKIVSNLAVCELQKKKKLVPKFLDFNQTGFIGFEDLKHFALKMGSLKKGEFLDNYKINLIFQSIGVMGEKQFFKPKESSLNLDPRLTGVIEKNGADEDPMKEYNQYDHTEMYITYRKFQQAFFGLYECGELDLEDLVQNTLFSSDADILTENNESNIIGVENQKKKKKARRIRHLYNLYYKRKDKNNNPEQYNQRKLSVRQSHRSMKAQAEVKLNQQLYIKELGKDKINNFVQNGRLGMTENSNFNITNDKSHTYDPQKFWKTSGREAFKNQNKLASKSTDINSKYPTTIDNHLELMEIKKLRRRNGISRKAINLLTDMNKVSHQSYFNNRGGQSYSTKVVGSNQFSKERTYLVDPTDLP